MEVCLSHHLTASLPGWISDSRLSISKVYLLAERLRVMMEYGCAACMVNSAVFPIKNVEGDHAEREHLIRQLFV